MGPSKKRKCAWSGWYKCMKCLVCDTYQALETSICCWNPRISCIFFNCTYEPPVWWRRLSLIWVNIYGVYLFNETSIRKVTSWANVSASFNLQMEITNGVQWHVHLTIWYWFVFFRWHGFYRLFESLKIKEKKNISWDGPINFGFSWIT